MGLTMKIIKPISFIALAFTAMFALSGCGSSEMIRAKMQMSAADYLNPDQNGQAAPVMVTFYELTSPVAFKQADYFALESNAGAVLGDSLVDKKTIEMRPGQANTHRLSMPESVQYIGVTAGYRNIDQSKWRAVVQVPKKKSHWYSLSDGHYLRVQVALHSQNIEVKLVK